MGMRISLRTRVLGVLGILVAATLLGSLVTVWYAVRMDRLFERTVQVDVAGLKAAEELETALLMQKGFVTYYYLYGEPRWLDELYRHQEAFHEGLKKVRNLSYRPSELEILNQIEAEYIRYVFFRDQVIRLYREGERQEGALLHEDVRGKFHRVYGFCEQYKALHEGFIDEAVAESRSRARAMTLFASLGSAGVCLLAGLLSYILLKYILAPIRRLAVEGSSPVDEGNVDEVQALSQRVYSLIEHVDEAKTRLERSREHLLQSEKWVLVGKLAAGMAHSIRNPLTSVKMRLFSLARTLELSETEKEDFEVISEEIAHIDTIVQNFLEFSRPPKLLMQQGSPSDVVDVAVQLLRHRFDSYGVRVEVKRAAPLPHVWLDPEQLKEALVNLLLNACEAMQEGGSIGVEEEERIDESGERVVMIRVADTGPGIPKSIQEKVFQPFFSTKEEGTGLGLSIACRIVEGHGGALSVRSEEGKGAVFCIVLRRP